MPTIDPIICGLSCVWRGRWVCFRFVSSDLIFTPKGQWEEKRGWQIGRLTSTFAFPSRLPWQGLKRFLSLLSPVPSKWTLSKLEWLTGIQNEEVKCEKCKEGYLSFFSSLSKCFPQIWSRILRTFNGNSKEKREGEKICVSGIYQQFFYGLKRFGFRLGVGGDVRQVWL